MKKQTKKYLIAIDGPSAAGKSTIARIIAQKLGYLYIDTGAMYRAIALKVIQNNLSPDKKDAIILLTSKTRIDLRPADDGCSVLLDGIDVSKKIRSTKISQVASQVSIIPEVRSILVRVQQCLGKNGGVIMEGRDIGSKVFPDADLKIFLDASEPTRAKRRFAENKKKSGSLNLAKTLQEIRQRDQRDRTRQASPLIQTKDSTYLDSSGKTITQVVSEIIDRINYLKGEKVNSNSTMTAKEKKK